MKKSLFIILISLFSLGHQTLLSNEIEEIVVTGTLLKDIESDSSPVEQITNEDFDNLNVESEKEISKRSPVQKGYDLLKRGEEIPKV